MIKEINEFLKYVINYKENRDELEEQRQEKQIIYLTKKYGKTTKQLTDKCFELAEENTKLKAEILRLKGKMK